MTGTTTDNIDELIQLINASENTLRYNSSIQSDISQNGGTVVYSYNNIIMASEISDELYIELQKNPYIEFIEDLPMKKYGEVDIDLINQLDVETLTSYNNSESDSIVDGSVILNSGSTTSVVDGLSGAKKPDSKTLESNVASGTESSGIPPTIINEILVLSASTTSWFDYPLYVNGSSPITFEVIKPTNYVGSVFLQDNNIVSGQTTVPGIYDIKVSALNDFGVNTKTLTLTILNSVDIINDTFDVYNKVGTHFSYTIEATGDAPITYDVSGLTSGLTLTNNVISGVLPSGGTYTMTIGISNAVSSDSEILTLTAGYPPIITSSGQISSEQYSGFTYIVTSEPISGVTYNILGILPDGLQFNVDTISGIPVYDGVYNLQLKGTNQFGVTLKDLIITIYGI